MESKMKIAIIGHGFVGKAVDFGFDQANVEKIIIDPRDGTSVDDLNGQKLDAAFVCVPTPMGDDGSINSSIVEDVVTHLKYKSEVDIIIIKSTTTPDVIEVLQSGFKGDAVIFNPEFLTERNYKEDFINPPFHVLGGERAMCMKLLNLYEQYSKCNPAPAHFMTGVDAAFTKYGINSYLASKVLWFNQFHDIVQRHNGNYNVVLKAITSDPRITSSHTQVPGFDGKQGFGGACFPKDTSALLAFDKSFSVLAEVIRKNNEYRNKYTKDARELEQNINYGDSDG